MSYSIDIAQPECATVAGSWCERIWRLWSVDWLAAAADVVVNPALRILLIVVLALIVKALLHRLVDRLTRATVRGLVPGRWVPFRDRLESSVLGAGSVARRRERAESIGSLLKSVSSFVIVVVAFILVLAELGINVAPLLASAGIAGIAIGFGAQNLVKDFLAGIAMILEDQCGVGDSVDLGTVTGTVLATGLRTTTLRSADGTVWYVRNGEIVRVGNASQSESVVDIDVPLKIGVNTQQAGEIVLEAARRVAESEKFVDSIIAEPHLAGISTLTFDAAAVRVSTTVRAGTQHAFSRAVRMEAKTALDRAGLMA
jgi:moderate conductance mechanosensitive channel